MFKSKIFTQISKKAGAVVSDAKPFLCGAAVGISPIITGTALGLSALGMANFNIEKNEGLSEQIELKKSEMVADGFSKKDLSNFKYSLWKLPTGGNPTTLRKLKSLQIDSKYSGIKSRTADSLRYHEAYPTWTAGRVHQQLNYIWR